MTSLNNIHCPQCQQQHTWNQDNPYRPFCSERCKLTDLGDWAAENHRIVGEPATEESTDITETAS